MTTFAEKLQILSELVRGLQPEHLAKLFGVTEEEVNRIGVNHQLIMEVGHYFNISEHLPLLGGHYPRMENILYAWFADRSRVTNSALTKKAIQILDILGEQPKSVTVKSFTASRNWLRGFKARYCHLLVGQRPADMVAEPTTLSDDGPITLSDDDDIKTETEFKIEPELQSQNIDYDATNSDDQNDTMIIWNGPTADDNFSPEDVNESASTSKLNPQTETSQFDEREDALLTQRSTVSVDADENSSPNDFIDPTSTGQRSQKRKAGSLDESTEVDADEFSLSEEFNDEEPPKKGARASLNVLVPTRTGVKTMKLEDYETEKVIRIFKPVLKYAKDSGWSAEDAAQLHRLYTKSVLSCGQMKKQPTITNYFRKAK